MNTQTHTWYQDFFTGMALEAWTRGISPQQTADEVEFVARNLNVKPGANILDAPCGNGRLSHPLAAIGLNVTGIDTSTHYIAQAEQAKRDRPPQSKKAGMTRFISADMQTYQTDNPFDGAICMGNSFGYFDRTNTSAFFYQMASNLKTGGRFILDSMMIAETFLVNGGEREWLQLDDMRMLIQNDYDCRNNRLTTQYTFLRGGQEETRTATHYIYTCGELCHMLETAGFAVMELLDDASPDAQSYTLGADRLVAICRKV